MPDKDTTPPDHTDLSELDFPEQFDELWQKIEEIATDAIDKHHECGGGEDAHIIANEVRKLFQQYAQPPVVADEEIDGLLGLLRLEVSEGSAWMQSNGEQSWEMPPPSLIKIVGTEEAKAALLQREQRLVAEARIDELERAYPEMMKHQGLHSEGNYYYDDRLAQLRHNANTGKEIQE